MSRWARFLIAIVVGTGLGLIYGWVINPVEYVDTTPRTLKIDYKTDYVLMVAEVYQADGDLPQATRRLALLQEMPLSELTHKALLFAQRIGYADRDLAQLRALHQSILTYDQPLETTYPLSESGFSPSTPSEQEIVAP